MKTGVVDLAAVLFVVGGVASFVMTLLTVPLVNIRLPATFITVFILVLAISLICSIGAIHCYTLATKRMLSEAGMRGMIFGALLVIFSVGFVGNFIPAASVAMLAELSGLLVLMGGMACFVLRHSGISSSPVTRQEAIPQPA